MIRHAAAVLLSVVVLTGCGSSAPAASAAAQTSAPTAAMTPPPTPAPTPVPTPAVTLTPAQTPAPTSSSQLSVAQECIAIPKNNPPNYMDGWHVSLFVITYTGTPGSSDGGVTVFPDTSLPLQPGSSFAGTSFGRMFQYGSLILPGDPHKAYFLPAALGGQTPGAEVGKQWWVAWEPGSPGPDAVSVTIRKCP